MLHAALPPQLRGTVPPLGDGGIAANEPGTGPRQRGASVLALDVALAGEDSPAVTEGLGHPGVMRELTPLFSSQVAKCRTSQPKSIQRK